MDNTQKLLSRNQVDKQYTWHLEDMYATDTQWEKSYERMESELPKLASYEEGLLASSDTLAAFLKYMDSLGMEIERLYVYANMRLHEDSSNSFYQSLSNRAEMLIVKFSQAIAFFQPKITGSAKKAEAYLKENIALKDYTQFLSNILRQASHTLTPMEESILAKTGEFANAGEEIFTMLNDADISFPSIYNKEGKEFQLTKGRYTSFLESEDRVLRQSAFDTLYSTYGKQKNTLAAIHYANVKKDVFYASVRNYASSLEAALTEDNIPIPVYENLIKTVHKHLPVFYKYIALRKKLLGVEELHMYDLYAPLVPNVDQKYPYEESKKIVAEGLAPLGKDYIEALCEGFRGGWIDVYENQGKRGGAYSWGAFPGHPYVLLNHNNTINSLFTVAHEMGHALHSYYTWKTQPYINGGHKIFIAEVASTVNEALLMEHLLKTTTDKKARLYLLNYFMEQFRGTLFRQTMFAEFEKATHEMVEAGQPLTCDGLMELYHKLNQLYFGDGIIIDDKIDIEWARIPHFYNAFYVYQYATGYSAAIALSRKILKEGEPTVKKYREFLTKGNSEYPIEQLKGAGVDMTTPNPIDEALTVFGELIAEMEQETL